MLETERVCCCCVSGVFWCCWTDCWLEGLGCWRFLQVNIGWYFIFLHKNWSKELIWKILFFHKATLHMTFTCNPRKPNRFWLRNRKSTLAITQLRIALDIPYFKTFIIFKPLKKLPGTKQYIYGWFLPNCPFKGIKRPFLNFWSPALTSRIKDTLRS